jgi:hypothetical protein
MENRVGFRQTAYLIITRTLQEIWKFADQKVNVFGPDHIEKSHFKGVLGVYILTKFDEIRREYVY